MVTAYFACFLRAFLAACGAACAPETRAERAEAAAKACGVTAVLTGAVARQQAWHATMPKPKPPSPEAMAARGQKSFDRRSAQLGGEAPDHGEPEHDAWLAGVSLGVHKLFRHRRGMDAAKARELAALVPAGKNALQSTVRRVGWSKLSLEQRREATAPKVAAMAAGQKPHLSDEHRAKVGAAVSARNAETQAQAVRREGEPLQALTKALPESGAFTAVVLRHGSCGRAHVRAVSPADLCATGTTRAQLESMGFVNSHMACQACKGKEDECREVVDVVTTADGLRAAMPHLAEGADGRYAAARSAFDAFAAQWRASGAPETDAAEAQRARRHLVLRRLYDAASHADSKPHRKGKAPKVLIRLTPELHAAAEVRFGEPAPPVRRRRS